ncbi:DUF3618 domain-containing protein [Mycobacterium sp. IDR2000157661]|uniref:DUF3618 domain-containing protein n=1 Tax=Mycobacterium sp. IDR2000157661 TaxID=2867005 RepID=UPI001EEAE904|nr:DUF3618 domain-containing protein [Mycobacterium sp. IDR2000157661]ULE32864.1 DUF3618 domain-containing protein [Mycobacterium sp. IDR2000157661]
MTAPDPRPEPGPDADIKDIEADIEQTRAELGDTVEALTAKMDVKGRTRDKIDETKERTREKVDETRQRVVETAEAVRHTATDNPQRTIPVAAIVLVSALAVGILIWRRRR